MNSTILELLEMFDQAYTTPEPDVRLRKLGVTIEVASALHHQSGHARSPEDKLLVGFGLTVRALCQLTIEPPQQTASYGMLETAAIVSLENCTPLSLLALWYQATGYTIQTVGATQGASPDKLTLMTNIERFERVLRLATTLADSFRAARAHAMIAELHWHTGNLEAAAVSARQAFECVAAASKTAPGLSASPHALWCITIGRDLLQAAPGDKPPATDFSSRLYVPGELTEAACSISSIA